MKKLLFIFLLPCIVSGCSRRVIPVASETVTAHTERIIDTVTHIVRDSSLLEALLECDSLGQIRIADLRAENSHLIQQNLYLRDNLLSVQAAAQSEERVRAEVKADTVRVYQEVPVPYPEEVNRLFGWQKALIWIGLLYLVRTGARIALNWKQITFKTFLKFL
jgi:hypothetical protein